MRALKIVLIVVAGLAVLLIGGAVALLVLVDPNDYRDDIERLAKERTGRELDIDGQLDLDFFPWLALRIEKVTLGNPPGYAKEAFATVEQASVGVRLIPLIRGEVEVSRIGVEGLVVTLVSRSDTENNWKDLLAEEEEAAAESKGGATPTIAGIDVTRSRLVYKNEAEGSTVQLANLGMHAGRLGGDDPVPLHLEFDFLGEDPEAPVHVKLDTRALLPKQAGRLELTNLGIEGRQGDTPFTVRAPSVQLDLDAEKLAPTELEVTYGAMPLTLTASGERLFGERLVSGVLVVPEVNLRELMQSLEVEPPVTSDPNALSKLALRGEYRLTENALAVSGLDLTLDDTRVRGSAGIEDLESLRFVFDLTVDAIDVDRYLEPESEGGAEPAAGAAPAEEEELPVEALRELNGRGTLRIARAKLSGLEFTGVTLPVDARGGLVRLGPTSAQLYGGRYAGNVVLDARPATLRLSLDERLSGIDLGKVLQATFDTGRLAGRGDATAKLNGAGNTVGAIMKSLSGRTQFDVREGAFNGIDLWYELRRARALWKREAVPERSGEPRTTFNTFRGTALLDSGVVKNDDLRIETDYLRAGGKGTIDLGSAAIDYRLVAEVYELPKEGAGAELTELRAAQIPITISGTFADPKVRPDLGTLVKTQVKEKVDSKIEEKKEEVKKKLGDKLRDLLER